MDETEKALTRALVSVTGREEATTLFCLIEARARQMGLALSDFLKQYPLKIENAKGGLSVDEWKTARDEWHKDADRSMKNFDGSPKIFYHGTGGNIHRFISGDIGFHFGPAKAANDRLSQTGKASYGSILPVYLNIKNPLYMKDMRFWEPSKMAKWLYKEGIFSKEERDIFTVNIYDKDATLKNMKSMLAAKGYDGIIYKNIVEAKGEESVIAFFPDQIKSVFNKGTFINQTPYVLYQKMPDYLMRELDENGYYSQLERALVKMPNRMSSEDFIRYAKKNGVKDDELSFSNLDTLLTQQFVTKEEMVSAYSRPMLEMHVRSENNVRALEEAAQRAFFNYTEGYRRYLEAWRTEELNVIKDRIAKLEPKVKAESDRLAYSQMLKKLNALKEQRWELMTKSPVGNDVLLDAYKLTEEAIWLKAKSDEANMLARDAKNTPKEQNVKYFDYAIKGGKNYREILAVLQGDKMFQYRHWDEDNVLYHIRCQDFETADSKMLLVDEIQSDWHQKGRSEGYGSQEYERYEELQAKARELRKENEVFVKRLTEAIVNTESNPKEQDQTTRELLDTLRENKRSLEETEKKMRDIVAANGGKLPTKHVPKAPFAKTWHEKAFKDIIWEAITKGYDAVAIVDAKTQCDRYEIIKHVGSVVYDVDNGSLRVYRPPENKIALNGGMAFSQTIMDESELDEVLGKVLAQKIKEKAPIDGKIKIEGLDLKLGGEGMTKFYDTILPNYIRKYIKKYDGVLTKKSLGEHDVWVFAVTPQMRESIMTHGQSFFQTAYDDLPKALIRFGINPDETLAVITLLKDADISSLPHELAHYFRRTLDDSLLAKAEEVFDVKGGVWLEKNEEDFANGFVKYLATRNSTNDDLKIVFEKYGQWLKELFEEVKNMPEADFELTADQILVYDQMLGIEYENESINGRRDSVIRKRGMNG